jgi:hypothetical protein
MKIILSTETMVSFLSSSLSGFLLGLFFDSENGSDEFFRNVWLSPNYTSLNARRLHSSTITPFGASLSY